MHRLAVRDDHVLERKLKQGAQRRQCSLLMRRRSPTAQLAFRGRQPVGENEGTLGSHSGVSLRPRPA